MVVADKTEMNAIYETKYCASLYMNLSYTLEFSLTAASDISQSTAGILKLVCFHFSEPICQSTKTPSTLMIPFLYFLRYTWI